MATTTKYSKAVQFGPMLCLFSVFLFYLLNLFGVSSIGVLVPLVCSVFGIDLCMKAIREVKGVNAPLARWITIAMVPAILIIVYGFYALITYVFSF